MRLLPLLLGLLVFLRSVCPAGTVSTPLQVVTAMVHNEEQARKDRIYFRYISFERSTRTGGHLWREVVVETPDGPLRRLTTEDGEPLSPERARAEENRITSLVADPAAFRSSNANRRADESRIGELLETLPRAFLFTEDGMQDGCTRIAYRPNPAYNPKTYDERVAHSTAGIVLIQKPALRLCAIDGHLLDRVSFGFGLLGYVEKGSYFNLVRTEVSPGQWKSSRIGVHIDGKILLLKSLSRDMDAVHTGDQPLPPNLTLEQAAAMTQP